jgi:transglutaminase-like putative cysteine protease
MEEYLEPTGIIDWKHPDILPLAGELSEGLTSDEDVARACFEWVRDNVLHSWDHGLNPVTCRASDVLRHKTGYCYAKSHLLAALLRANGIPAGFCYQRLGKGEGGGSYCLHGLNAVYLNGHGWYRIDPRGNKEGVDAQFSPPEERLAFSPGGEHEADLPGIHASPLDDVVSVLEQYSTCEELYDNLPDIDPNKTR